VAISISGLAKALQGQQRFTEAEQLFRQAITIERSVAGDKHPAVGVDTSNLAECLMDMQRYAEAEPLLLEAERLLIASSGEAHPRVLKTRRRLARLYRALNRPDRAAQYEHS
jgi:tetratricopeptide (TPR) repeat protein